MGDKMLTPEDAAKRLQVTPRTVRSWLRKGTIKGTKIGNLWRISEATIDAYENAAQGDQQQEKV